MAKEKKAKTKTPKNSSRASDLGSLLLVGSTGFTVRKRTGVGLFVHFFLLGAMVLLGASLLVWYKSLEGCMLAVVIGACFALIAQNLERLKKVKQSLEFMNALFSSALGKGYQFCCVVKNSGEIVFYNRPFQSLFPAYVDQTDRHVNTLLTLYNVTEQNKDKLAELMATNTEGSLTVLARESDASPSTTLTLHLEPIERPTGYFLLRGK